jgi:hypothetical protein
LVLNDSWFSWEEIMRFVYGVAGTAAVAMQLLTATAPPAAQSVKMSYVAVNGYVNGYVAKDQFLREARR